ncbi:MAG: hypothetical protein FJ304_21380 [Planctomycetes bacterium]|nr:hypothetical protein [Planctomycetota bacterium]
MLIDRPTTRARSLAPSGGHVLLSATDRAEFDRQFEAWPGNPVVTHLASWYTGPAERFQSDFLLARALVL